jgi:hypothetical protein
MSGAPDGIRRMLLGIQVTLLGFVAQYLRLVPEEVTAVLLLLGTILVVAGFADGRSG